MYLRWEIFFTISQQHTQTKKDKKLNELELERNNVQNNFHCIKYVILIMRSEERK